MASFTRESKLRQSAVTLTKKEQHYENLKTFQIPNDVNSLSANSLFLAYVDATGTGSSLAVLPHSSTGKNHVPITSPAYAQPIVRAHGQGIQDFEFSAFNPHQIFTCSTDKTIKLWKIPDEGLVVDVSSPLASCSLDEQVPVRGLSVNPAVPNILAGRGSRSIALFDTTTMKTISSNLSSLAPAGDYQSLAWSFRGDLLVTTAKDKVLRFIDPRTTEGTVSSAPAHVGLRFCRTIWLGDSPYLLSCGHNNAQEREIMLWDSRNIAAGCLKRERVDSGYGPLIPLYDADLNSLVLMGKGDSSLRVYEMDVSDSAGVLYPLSNNTVSSGSSDATKGACLLPKQANDLMACEVMRVLKLSDNTVQPVSITVPRKERFKFHEDLFPPTFCEAPAAITSEEWLTGENRARSRVALVPKETSGSVKFSTSGANSPKPDSPVPGDSRGESPVPGDGELSSEPPSRAVSKRFSSLTSTSKFRHMYGTESTKECSFFNLSPDLSAMDSPIVACSEAYFAIPHRAGGGPVFVSQLNTYGKVEPDCAVVNGHKAPVQDISFSPFHTGLMATGSGDSTIKIWDVDSCFQHDTASLHAAALSSLEPSCAITKHTNSIRTVNFHPTVSGLLCSTAQDMTLRYFDAEQGSEVSCLQIPQAATINVSFNYDGSLIALAGKDRTVRIADARAGAVVMTTESSSLASASAGSRSSVGSSNPSVGRNLRVAWCCTRSGAYSDPLLTVSAGNSGLRQVHLWDPRNLTAPLVSKSIDNASGQLFPMFDETMNTVFLVGKGDTIIRTYEMLFLDETTPGFVPGELCNPSLLEKSTDFQSNIEPFAGVCMLPKRCCDVRNIEVARVLKLTTDAVTPISFKVPRADHLKEYFHDDLFPPVRARSSLATVPDWESADSDMSLFQPLMECLQPEGMMAISSAPVEPTPSSTRSKVDSFKQEQAKAAEESRQREDKFARLQAMAVQNSQYNKNLSGGTSNIISSAPTTATAARVAAAQMAAQATEEVDSDDNWDDDN